MKIDGNVNYINIKLSPDEILHLATLIHSFNQSFELASKEEQEEVKGLKIFTEDFNIEYHNFLTTNFNIGR